MSIPLASLAAQVTSTGIDAPSYADIYGTLQLDFQGIYGSDVVIDPDSQDGEMLSIFAQAIFDTNQTAVAVYNQFSPATAQGTGLSSVVKINGLTRESPTNSTALCDVGGTAGTVITNGAATDTLGQTWTLPDTVTIPNTGTITVTVTAADAGAVNAEASTITVIATPTRGWQTITNAAAATPGQPVEQDATLRLRQSTSTSNEAESLDASILGTVANLPGVTASALYENPNNLVDANSLPPHSIAVVVSGGDAMAVANAIFTKKTPGTYTYGTTSEIVVDGSGNPNTIRFFELSLVGITVGVSLRAQTNYVSSTGALISSVLAAYISQLGIGQSVILNRLWGPASLDGDVATTTTGMTQAQLDVLAKTYIISGFVISRTVPQAATTIVNGPYGVGEFTFEVANLDDFYLGAPVGVVMDNAAQLTGTVTALDVALNQFTMSNPITIGRQVFTDANVFLTQDVSITFIEAASCAAADVTVTPT